MQLLGSAFKFTQTPGTSREHSRLPCAPRITSPLCAWAQPEYHGNTHGKHLSSEINTSARV